MKINQLQPNENNPRLIKGEKFKKLVQSIKDFPEMLELRPIVIDEDNVILGGNMRYRACIEAGLKEVPVKIAKGLTEEQKQEFIVKDNVGFGEWDWAMLGNEWDNVKLGEWGLDVWQPDEDIKEILEFDESVNFIVKCENIQELEELQKKLNINASKTKCQILLDKIK
jgi:hypothetical protein